MDFLHRGARCDTQTIQHCLNHDSVLSSAEYELNRISKKKQGEIFSGCKYKIISSRDHWYINENNAKEYDIA